MGLIRDLIRAEDPLPRLLTEMVDAARRHILSGDLALGYEELEEEISGLERWLFEVWGMEMYRLMLEFEPRLSIREAFGVASRIDANVLIADGYSFREHVLLERALGRELSFSLGLAAVPTTTSAAASSAFETQNMAEAFRGSLLIEGVEWEGIVVEDVRDPPRIGTRSGLAILSYYPDAPLHEAVKYGVVRVQDLEDVLSSFSEMVRELSSGRDLVVTGDHGYIFLGDNPNRYLWRWKRVERVGGSYSAGESLEVDGKRVAVGRWHAPSSGSFIAHGGVSLAECLVPITVVRRWSTG
ncbi:MAG: hypothetical protein DRO06_02005 [Thermoproteota archaeon]|nr:MAG: hypothetical protein DRO06_02005 [Candidatus Korarchaeota archaeon]